MNVDGIIEYLKGLPEDATVRLLVMDKASGRTGSDIVENVIDGGVWCREDVGTIIGEAGVEPTRENVDRVLAAVPDGLDSFGGMLAEDGWDDLHAVYDSAIKSL